LPNGEKDASEVMETGVAKANNFLQKYGKHKKTGS
jgi:hypothetical protein